MSFSVAPKSGPTMLSPPTTTASTPVPGTKAAEIRARAISKFVEGAPPETPASPKVESSPEVKQSLESQSPPSVGQKHTDEAVVEAKDPTTTSPEATKSKEELLSTQYAILARKEKALRARVQQQQAAAKAKEEAILAREAAIKAKEAEYSKDYVPKNKIMEDPLSALSELGLTYDQITQAALSSPDPQYRELQMEIKALKDAQERSTKALEDQRKEYERQQRQSYEQAKNQIRIEVKGLVESDPEFETIKATGSVDDVVDLIEETLKVDGTLLTAAEAAKEVEEYLAEEAYKLAQLKKIQARFKPQTPAPKEPAVDTKESAPTMKTLTNSVGSSRQLTARERAELAFKGQLNK